LTAQTRKELSK